MVLIWNHVTSLYYQMFNNKLRAQGFPLTEVIVDSFKDDVLELPQAEWIKSCVK